MHRNIEYKKWGPPCAWGCPLQADVLPPALRLCLLEPYVPLRAVPNASVLAKDVTKAIRRHPIVM